MTLEYWLHADAVRDARRRASACFAKCRPHARLALAVHRRFHRHEWQRNDPGHWDFYLAYTMFRVAAIRQGIMRRALDGNAASQNALDAGRSARQMAEAGWRRYRRYCARLDTSEEWHESSSLQAIRPTG